MVSKLRYNALISLLATAFILVSVIVCSAEKANYVYDKENRLIRVEYATGTTEESFYDAVGNLVSQNVIYNISVTPTAYNFGTVYVGATSTANTFTVQNSGVQNLLIGSLTLSGLHPSQFGIRNDNCSGHTLSTFGSCTVQAVFAPTSAGTKNANLVIPSSDPDMPNLTVPLSGTALNGNYSISGTVLKANKKPLSGVTMTLSGAATGTATTNTSGNYTFTGLFNGTFTITPQKTGYTFTPTSRTIVINGANVVGQDFTGK
jgi:YD repeat-containing protein